MVWVIHTVRAAVVGSTEAKFKVSTFCFICIWLRRAAECRKLWHVPPGIPKKRDRGKDSRGTVFMELDDVWGGFSPTCLHRSTPIQPAYFLKANVPRHHLKSCHIKFCSTAAWRANRSHRCVRLSVFKTDQGLSVFFESVGLFGGFFCCCWTTYLTWVWTDFCNSPPQ